MFIFVLVLFFSLGVLSLLGSFFVVVFRDIVLIRGFLLVLPLDHLLNLLLDLRLDLLLDLLDLLLALLLDLVLGFFLRPWKSVIWPFQSRPLKVGIKISIGDRSPKIPFARGFRNAIPSLQDN
jgi:hypothetical protein